MRFWHPLLAVALVVAATLLLGPPAVAAPSPVPVRGGWPLPGPPVVLRGFDPPESQWGPGHRGVDLAAGPGQEVLSAAAGRVAFAGRVAGKPVVVIEHGGVRTTYEPVLAAVTVGQPVRAGQPIGQVGGGSHCAEGCLHWGLRRGDDYLDPLSLLGAAAGSDASLRLFPADRRRVVEREAAARTAATATAAISGFAAGPLGPAGSHGFSRPVPGAVTSPYGMRFHPVLHVTKLHDGTDFGAACSTAIRAPYAGRVGRVSFTRGYGNRLFLDHGRVDGHDVQTAYNHATGYVVRPGQHVSRGQVIGYVGSTGFSTGCHLHLMVWLEGHLVDPMSWL